MHPLLNLESSPGPECRDLGLAIARLPLDLECGFRDSGLLI